MAAASVGMAYGKFISMGQTLCLPIIVGGVAFASLKKGGDGAYALKFDMTVRRREIPVQGHRRSSPYFFRCTQLSVN